MQPSPGSHLECFEPTDKVLAHAWGSFASAVLGILCPESRAEPSVRVPTTALFLLKVSSCVLACE